MALSRTEIANRALDLIGADPIGSINDSTKPAALCNRLLSPIRDALLRRHPWNFASARAILPALATSPTWGFSNAFQLPDDYMRMIRLNTVDPTTPYKVEAEQILTNAAAPLGILYIQSISDTGRDDPLFTEALILALARDLAKPIANDSALRTALARDFADALRDARSADAAEGTPDLLWADTLILSRLI